MLSGDNGILQKATTAKENTNSSQIQERINLAYHSSLVGGKGEVSDTSLESELKKEFNKTSLDEGWLDKNSVPGKWKIIIDGVSLEIPAGKDTNVQLSIGDTVNYSTTLNGQTLDGWKLFYIEGDYCYIILDDYLPNSAISNSLKTSYSLSMDGDYGIGGNGSREDLINAMAEKSNWDSLLSGSINGNPVNQTRTTNVWAMGSPDLELWINSWNTMYSSNTLYTRYLNSSDIDALGWTSYGGAPGYAVGTSEPASSWSIDLSAYSGYDNELFFPRKSEVSTCYGYWLASPFCVDDGVTAVYCDGGLDNRNKHTEGPNFISCRPVVRIPLSAINQ